MDVLASVRNHGWPPGDCFLSSWILSLLCACSATFRRAAAAAKGAMPAPAEAAWASFQGADAVLVYAMAGACVLQVAYVLVAVCGGSREPERAKRKTT